MNRKKKNEDELELYNLIGSHVAVGEDKKILAKENAKVFKQFQSYFTHLMCEDPNKKTHIIDIHAGGEGGSRIGINVGVGLAKKQPPKPSWISRLWNNIFRKQI